LFKTFNDMSYSMQKDKIVFAISHKPEQTFCSQNYMNINLANQSLSLSFFPCVSAKS
jgi:hypothetical protein